MGNCQSQEEKAMVAKSKAIDREMIQGRSAQLNTVKLLLLG